MEELIRDDTYSLFSTIYNMGRPDDVSTALLEGKITIIVNGAPYVLTASTTFIESFVFNGDYHYSIYNPALFRLVRLLSFFLTVFVPSICIALATFDQELIPTPSLLNIMAQREGIPLLTFWEGILMEIISEVLRKARVRMPRTIGPATSIVGALALRQVAIQVGFIPAAVVVMVSITVITSFHISNTAMADALRMTQFIVMVLAACMGLCGTFICMFGPVLHFYKLKSIGVPYVIPVAPVIPEKNTDHIFRVPLWARKKYSSLFSKTKKLRNHVGSPAQKRQT